MRTLSVVLFSIYAILIALLIGVIRPSIPDTNSTPSQEEHPEPETPASQEEQRRAERIGGSGDLKITLLWDFYGDIDLHVYEPSGNHIYYGKDKNPRTGGFLDVDNTSGGPNSGENIYWSNPPSGRYKVNINYYGTLVGAGTCTVVVQIKDQQPHSYKVNMNRGGQTEHICNINID